MAQRIRQGSTDSLRGYPPGHMLGVPSSAFVRVGTMSSPLPEEADEEAATVDGVNASTNADAEAGATSLVFASNPALTVGNLYLVDVQGGILVEAASTGTTCRLVDPLPFDVPSGTAVRGVAITHALTAAETSSAGEGLVIWKATIGGVVRQWSERLDVVPLFGGPALDEVELQRRWPSMREQIPNDLTPQMVIESAWDQEIAPELGANGIRVDDVRNHDVLKPPTVAAVQLLCYSTARPDDAGTIERLRADLKRQMDRAIAHIKWSVADHPDEERPSESDRVRPSRVVRVTR